MTRFASMPETLKPADESQYRAPVAAETADTAAPDGPALKHGFEFLSSVKRSLTGEAVSAKQLLVVTSQLAVMLAAGCDLCAGLDAMARQQAHPQLKKIMADLHERVKQGQSFSAALAQHPAVFSDLYVTMVRAGESAGLLRQMLAALQLMIRNNIRIVSSIRSALMYPIILTCVAIGAITVMTTFVLPRFAKVFRDSHVPLPPITSFVIASSEVLAHYFLWIILGILALAGFVIWLLHHPAVRDWTHKWILKFPLLGLTLQLAYVCRSIQTLGMLVKSGLPLAEALILTRDMMPNVYYWRFFDRLRAHIGEGKSLSSDFETTTLFPPMVTQMMSVGEQTGTLANVSLEIASFHEEELQNRIKILTTALEPLIIVMLGGFVGFIAVSIILPMFKLSSTVH
jgi:type IV pilus assembly protein PilC